MLKIKIKTWSCSECGYKQDFKPTKELMEKHFNKSDDFCPSCRKVKLKKEADTNKKMIMNIRNTDEEIIGKDGKKRIEKALVPAQIQEIKDKYEDK